MTLPEPPPGYREIPDRLNMAEEALREVERAGERTAFVWDGGSLSFREFAARVDRLAHGLSGRGVERSMPVLVFMGNCREFAETVVALLKIGALPVLLNSSLGEEEVDYVVDHSEARAAVTLSGCMSALAPVAGKLPEGVIVARGGEEPDYETIVADAPDRSFDAADTAADDPAFFVYTSGTTGRPKGIVHAHRWIVALGDSNRYRLPPAAEDRVLATGEWSFVSALGHNVLFPLRNGVTGVVLEDRPSPRNVLRAVERHRVTLLYSVATVYRRILAERGIEDDYDLSSLRGCNATGEALEAATWREFRDRVGCEIWEHYGVSEMQMVLGQGPRRAVRPGSPGMPMPGTTVAVTDDDGNLLADGETGRLLIAADDPGFFLGYHKEPERTREAMRDGWYHTGDLGYRDADGYFWIAGRSDDCFKSRGIFISPYEIENVLRQHPAVAEACVVPRDDAEIGNRIRAICVLRGGERPGGPLAEDIRRHVADRIARHKVPHLVDFATALPKSPVGKVLRRELAS